VDPITVAAQITLGLQLIPSRQIDVTKAPAVVTIGMIQGGIRGNIIPDSVVMVGTIRTFDDSMRADIHRRIRRTAEQIAQSQGATAMVSIPPEAGYPLTFNDPGLTDRSLPTLRRIVGDSGLMTHMPITGAEDFSEFQKKIPGFFFFLGVTPRDRNPETVPKNHSPLFFADEAALPVGVRSLAHLAVDWLSQTRAAVP
jgi:amidohydrolase